ncbi:HAMP domain-containing histidine kinase [Micromonospora sp. DR5-3]|uniref:sensor histidine kinase n=1 Tax=unclassified Micromonospora TaxID=2617518 RepID=UPI0011D7AF62|nr:MULTISPECIES: HAMP domain-containing sensor histidine kinase [unclassified Micromonospora]MCW3815121.1 HAMP domain-containing histidine kinase [Micromonospora sp. DR5-3]TYC22001.1 HAMP domain-containing histidine kinase [Micromonospora sp. MP36]
MRTPSTDRILAAVWALFAAVNVALMWFLPGQETVPFHLVWISLALVYGFTTWPLSWIVATLVAVTTTTGVILAHHAAAGEIRWEETAEEPLMAVIFIVMAWHVHRRHVLLHQMRRLGEAERDRAHRQELLVRLASHELRTPLTIARGYTELLRTAHDDPSTVDDTAVVLDELDKATRITHRLVTLMQLEQQHPVRRVDLDAELARIARRWAPTADRDWSCRSAIGLTRVNPERLEAALDCLIENAVKFTGPGDRIALVGRRDATGWTVEVVDSGSGIPPDVVPELLAGRPGRPTATGTGLGLATVRAVAGALGGRVTVGAGPGGGARVGLRVPEPPPTGPTRPEAARPELAESPVRLASG